MLLKENFSEEYIRSLQKDSKRDPVLLERTVYAFGLLEALARVRMEESKKESGREKEKWKKDVRKIQRFAI